MYFLRVKYLYTKHYYALMKLWFFTEILHLFFNNIIYRRLQPNKQRIKKKHTQELLKDKIFN